MKSILTFVMLLATYTLYGQELFFSSDGKPVKEVTLSLDSAKNNDITVYITYQGTQTGIVGKVKLLKVGTMEDLTIVNFQDVEHTFNQSSTIGLQIRFKQGFFYKTIQDKNVILGLESTTANVVKPENAILQIRLKKKEEKKKDFDFDDFNVTLFTGSNFQFFDKPQVKDFAGLLNIQAFNIIGRLGLNMGVSNINFSDLSPELTNSVANTVLPRRNVLLDPKAGFVNGVKYESIIYSNSLVQSTSSWSYFIQPTIRLHQDEISIVSILFHLELLNQTTKNTLSERLVGSDTLTLRLPEQQNLVLRSNKAPAPDKSFSLNFMHGYFGAGLAWNIKQKDKFNIMLHTATGFTTDNFKTRQNEYFNAQSAPRLPQPIDKKGSWFYFLRSVFTEKYTKLNGTIGFDLRGLNNYRPQMALYFGVRIDFNKFFGS